MVVVSHDREFLDQVRQKGALPRRQVAKEAGCQGGRGRKGMGVCVRASGAAGHGPELLDYVWFQLGPQGVSRWWWWWG